MAMSDAAWATIEALNEKIRAQAEEIERLKARGISRAEVEQLVHNFDGRPSVFVVCNWIDEHGLLLDNQPKQAIPFVGEMEVRPAEADPLKVDVIEGRYPAREMEVRRAHNALVDAFRQESKMNYESYAESIELHTERIIALEQRIEANDRGVAGAFDKAFAQIAALEHGLQALRNELIGGR